MAAAGLWDFAGRGWTAYRLDRVPPAGDTYPVRLNLDTRAMRDCMALLRGAFSINGGSGHLHLTCEETGATLDKVVGIIAGWSDLLHLCSPESESDGAELRAVVEEVASFREWVAEARTALVLARDGQGLDGLD